MHLSFALHVTELVLQCVLCTHVTLPPAPAPALCALWPLCGTEAPVMTPDSMDVSLAISVECLSSFILTSCQLLVFTVFAP